MNNTPLALSLMGCDYFTVHYAAVWGNVTKNDQPINFTVTKVYYSIPRLSQGLRFNDAYKTLIVDTLWQIFQANITVCGYVIYTNERMLGNAHNCILSHVVYATRIHYGVNITIYLTIIITTTIITVFI